jgi:hypothetical protein
MARAFGLPPDALARDILRAVENAISHPDDQQELARALGVDPTTPVGRLVGMVREMLNEDEPTETRREEVERRLEPRRELAEKAKRLAVAADLDFTTALREVVAREPDAWRRAQAAYPDRDADAQPDGGDPRERLVEAAQDVSLRERVSFTEAVARVLARDPELSERVEQHYRL